MGKKVLIAIGALFALFIVAAITIPFFVDVDKYRPQAVAKANEMLNGKLEIGKLSLSLWGQIKVNIDGVKLDDPSGQTVFSVKDAYFHIPFVSFLTGSPEIILKVDSPTVLAIKDKRGKLNMLGLVKSSGSQATAGQPVGSGQTASGAGSGAGNVSVPGFVARARIGFQMLHAHVTYRDATTDLKSEFPDMNFTLQDLSLTRTATIKFWTDIDTTMGKTLAVKGPIKVDGTATPQLVDSKFDHVSLDVKVDLDDLDVSSGAMLHKPKGMACNAELAVTASAKEAKIDKMNAKFLDAVLESSGVISNLSGGTADKPLSPTVQFQAKSNSIDFKPWSELVPMLKEYDLSGSAHFEASANGPADKLAYKAKLGVDGLSAKGPMLKEKPVINVNVDVSTDKVDRLAVSVKAPGNDLEVNGNVSNFAVPHVVMRVSSPGMDLDQLVDFPKPAAKSGGAAAPAAGGGGGAPAAGGKAADIDAMLAPIRENKMLAGMDINFTTDMKFVKAYGVKISDIGAKVTFKDLTAALEGFKLKVFDGAVKADFSVALKPAHPTYKFATGVDNLVIEQAVDSQLHLFKNTLLGKANFTVGGSGASFNTDAATSNLNAKGNFKVTDATFASIDIGKMVTDAVNKAITSAAEKVPPLKGKSVPGGIGANGSSKYDVISSDFTIAGGKFSAPNFVAKAQKDKGIDLKGATAVGLKDFSLNADWTVIDTYNLTKAADLSAPAIVGGGTVPHILCENGVFQYPQHVGGTLTSPQYSYGDVPAYFAKVAFNNMTKAATGQAKQQAQGQLQKLIPKNAPPAIGGLTKKLFGN